MKLYYVPATRSTRPRWLLEELEVPYELVRLDPRKKENRAPEYLAINPTGHVPAFVDDDGTPMFESLAICLHLADRFPEKGLAPPVGDPERGRYLTWAVFSMVSLEKSVDLVSKHTARLPEAERVASVAAAMTRTFHEDAAVVEAALQGKEYLVGGRFTVADLMMTATLGWAKLLGLLAEHPVLEEYVRRNLARPAAKRGRKD
jgi:glutathione S-transferase